MSGKAHGNISDQYMRKTILTSEEHFPYVRTRTKVRESKEVCTYICMNVCGVCVCVCVCVCVRVRVRVRVHLQYSSDLTLHSLVSNLLDLLCN